jgi:hypothetical protein
MARRNAAFCVPRHSVAQGALSHRDKEATMPVKTEKQRKFMGAELQRKREGKKTKTDMSEKELEKYASKRKESS